MAAGSATRSGPAGGTRPGPAGGTRPGPAVGTRPGAAGETGAAGEPVGCAGLAATCGMNAVGESATDGVEGPDWAGRLGVPEVVGRVGTPPGVPGRVGVAPGALPGDGGRLDAAPGAGGRVGALPGAGGRTGPWVGAAGRPGVAAGGRPDPPCGPSPGAALPGQGGGASTPGRAGVPLGSGRPEFGRAGCSARAGCSGRAGSTGSGQLPAGAVRPGAGSGRSTLGRKAVGSSAWSRCRPSRRSSGPLTWAPSPSAGRWNPRMPELAPWRPSPCSRADSRRPRP